MTLRVNAAEVSAGFTVPMETLPNGGMWHRWRQCRESPGELHRIKLRQTPPCSSQSRIPRWLSRMVEDHQLAARNSERLALPSLCARPSHLCAIVILSLVALSMISSVTSIPPHYIEPSTFPDCLDIASSSHGHSMVGSVPNSKYHRKG